MDDLLIDRVRSMIAEVLHAPLEDVKNDLSFGDLPQWDSMGHMDVMIALEERFGVEVNADTISQLVSVPVICSYLREKAKVG
jgi:acyl carrier protein